MTLRSSCPSVLSLSTLRRCLVTTVMLPLVTALSAASPPTTQPRGPVIDHIKQTGQIVLAYRESAVPFSYLDGGKKPVGYALDLCLKVAEAVRKKLEMKTLALEFMAVTPANRIAIVAEGKADLECGATTNNAERRQKVAFTVPHYITGARYMVRADSPIEQLAMFEGKKLVSTKGTTPLKTVRQANLERMLGINILEVPDHAKAVEMVQNGDADGFVMDDVQLFGLISSSPNPASLKVVGRFLTLEPLSIMLRRDDPVFKKIVDDEMKRLIYSREAHAIYDRWFNKPIPPRNLSLKLPMSYLLRDFWKYPSDWVPQ